MLNSHEFIFRDDVQFVRNHRYPNGGRQPSYQMHTPVYSHSGPLLLNAQIKKKSGLSIRKQQLSYEPDWTRKLINKLDEAYRKAPYYESIRGELVVLLENYYASLGELNIRTTIWGLCHLLGVEYSSSRSLASIAAQVASDDSCRLKNLSLGSEHLGDHSADAGTATDRILRLCKITGCRGYIAGGTAIDSYFELDKFEAGEVQVCRQGWTCEEYPQAAAGNSVFIANLSIIDLLANLGAPQSMALLTSNFSLNAVEVTSS